MFRRHDKARFVDYRSALAARGEIEIGVLARHRRRRNLAIAVLGIVLIGGAGWLYWLLLPAEDVVAGDEFRVKVQCINEACVFVGDVQVKAGQRFPLICPKCEQRSCRQLWRCKNPACRHEFLPPVVQLGKTVRCEKCQGYSVGTAVVGKP